MFFGYPLSATANNWLHDCIYNTLLDICDKATAGTSISRWPDILVTTDENRAKLSGRDKFKTLLYAVKRVIVGLNQADRDIVRETIVNQNRIEELLSNQCGCLKLQELPSNTQKAIKDLFDYLFGILTSLCIRQDHYKIIWNNIPRKDCPFCGLEYFEAPGAPQEDYDHYFAKKYYPFAAINLQNLVPSGGKCNRLYKGEKDIIFNDNATRRTAFYPYQSRSISVTLNNSTPFSGTNRNPLWQIDFIPNSPECITWDEVFSIRTRYKRDILDDKYSNWLNGFIQWFAMRIADGTYQIDDVCSALSAHISSLMHPIPEGKEFLRPKVFEMLLHKIQEGNTHTKVFIQSSTQMFLNMRLAG